MKKFFLKILWTSLKIPAKILLFRFSPKIIGITGSAGKTTTKDAIFWVLNKNSRIKQAGIRKTFGNLNTEIGVPLTILGFQNVPKGLAWIFYILSAFARAFFTFKYPKILILEMAADKPEDIQYLTSFVKPNIAVVTNVGPAHLEAFKTIENIAQEKGILIKNLKSGDFAVLNFDNIYTQKMGLETRANVIYFGLSAQAQIYIDNLKTNERGTQAKVYLGGSSAPLVLSGVGKAFIYAALTAISIACEVFDLDLVEVTQNLIDFKPVKDRNELISGKKHSLILNDTYNANPLSMQAALENINLLARERQQKILILGDMRELGKNSAFYHQEIGKMAGKIADYLLVVGTEAKNYLVGAKKISQNQNYQYFSNPEAAAIFALQKLDKDAIILIKGSRAMQMEKAVEILKN